MRVFRALILCLSAVAAPVAADTVHRETVHFERGSSGATINARVRGYNTAEYTLGVRAGQRMSIQLDANNSSAYFNVMAPGSSEALYNASISGNAASFVTPVAGNYVVQVYLMRNAARRDEAAEYSLSLYIE